MNTLSQQFTFDVYVPGDNCERELIAAIWFVRGRFPSAHQEQILPSGMVEMIFNLAEPVSFFRNMDGRQGSLPRCFISGVNRNDVTLLKGKEQHFIGIQFYPHGLKAVLGMPVHELTNSLLDLTLLCKEIDGIWHRLAYEPLFATQVSLLLSWLRRQMASRRRYADLGLMSHLFRQSLVADRSVAELRSEYCISERSLRRKSNEWFGMSTESFLLYRKYIRSLHMLHSPHCSLTEIAYHCGYYDQSHFIREFRSYTSMTPGEYRSEKSEHPGHIYRPA